MRVLRDSWCFCNGGGKTERMKASIFSSKGPAMAQIASCNGGGGGGTGFLIHRNLLLTTHLNLPSAPSAEAAEIRIQNGAAACLFPHRFFITSTVLDLSIVGIDAVDGDATGQPHFLKTCSKPNLELGSLVYLLGYNSEKNELTVGEGRVVIATDNLIKLCTDGLAWSPGSAGFDVHGNLAFMVCDPMKLATTSPNSRSSSTTSSSSWKKNDSTCSMQFGIPIPIICDWLNQHWEGNLDELNKPKLQLMRLVVSGGGGGHQRSDHSCGSFTMRQVFKGEIIEGTPTSSNSPPLLRPKESLVGPSGLATTTDQHGIPTPEIFESPKVTSSIATRKTESIPKHQLLDINFPPKYSPGSKRTPRVSKATAVASPQFARKMPSNYHEKVCGEKSSDGSNAEIASIGSINGPHSDVQSSSPVVEASEMLQQQSDNYYSSEGETTTMYSAETAESRNIPRSSHPPPPPGGGKAVGRSQSCMNYSNRWGAAVQTSSSAAHRRRTTPEKGRMVYSHGATASQRSNDFFSPTVSSIMKKRINLEVGPRPNRMPRHTPINASSPRWMF
ncbi:hypothetical protein DM860_012555 [Cuscuta australis]|uniref:Peptidase S1 domain-containing protein n=1 Tax=Cuscuta australis TaxID=267555 RepID=A0A328DD07_9ASTE|nr:hypothetical protein DM860_012555 [Cuscuta australis]